MAGACTDAAAAAAASSRWSWTVRLLRY